MHTFAFLSSYLQNPRVIIDYLLFFFFDGAEYRHNSPASIFFSPYRCSCFKLGLIYVAIKRDAPSA